ncbi:hypothetical protein BKA67DRAFT_565700 [Truncatella angustata]|uniref:Uncharacterized protein n=1 Tax=Truncatella angustata TaxID=152316 RepID=A0A9P8ZZ32_9PEZI|nr:uncharacterized protein BKA67DRAFT_565700 [Truncatella angustata]KAH6654605.1 hypothetical protein BKA67DRAFT_565700 [Truncatella angustata]
MLWSHLHKLSSLVLPISINTIICLAKTVMSNWIGSSNYSVLVQSNMTPEKQDCRYALHTFSRSTPAFSLDCCHGPAILHAKDSHRVGAVCKLEDGFSSRALPVRLVVIHITRVVLEHSAHSKYATRSPFT